MASKDTGGSFAIRALVEGVMEAFYALRLAGLEAHPEAFGESVEHFKSVSPSQLVERLKGAAARGGFILGAFLADGPLVGVVGLFREAGAKAEHRAVIWGMYVDPRARGSGIARRLVAEALARAQRIIGVTQVHLSVVTSNEAAVKLYKSLGFQIYGTDPSVLKVGAKFFDEYLMVVKFPDNYRSGPD